MMRRPRLLFPLLCALCLPLLSACTATANPLVKAEATPVPGVSMPLHAASAAEGNESELEATLYFQYMDMPYLAAETRRLTVQKDESNEMAVLRALLEGPSAEKIELKRLMRDDISVQDVSESDGLLNVTFNEAFLRGGAVGAEEPTETDAEEKDYGIRMLAVQSIVNTLTENFSYAGVQIMIDQTSDARADTRLNKSHFDATQNGPCDPFPRNEEYLLTFHNTAQLLLSAWRERDYETLYQFTAAFTDGSVKPVYDEFAADMDGARALTDYTVSPGSVTEDGQHATLSLTLSVLRDGLTENETALPMRLCRENGIWKITYSSLRRMMLP